MRFQGSVIVSAQQCVSGGIIISAYISGQLSWHASPPPYPMPPGHSGLITSANTDTPTPLHMHTPHTFLHSHTLYHVSCHTHGTSKSVPVFRRFQSEKTDQTSPYTCSGLKSREDVSEIRIRFSPQLCVSPKHYCFYLLFNFVLSIVFLMFDRWRRQLCNKCLKMSLLKPFFLCVCVWKRSKANDKAQEVSKIYYLKKKILISIRNSIAFPCMVWFGRCSLSRVRGKEQPIYLIYRAKQSWD